MQEEHVCACPTLMFSLQAHAERNLLMLALFKIRNLPHHGQNPTEPLTPCSMYTQPFILFIPAGQTGTQTHLAPSLAEIQRQAGRIKRGATFSCRLLDFEADLDMSTSQNDQQSPSNSCTTYHMRSCTRFRQCHWASEARKAALAIPTDAQIMAVHQFSTPCQQSPENSWPLVATPVTQHAR